MKKKMENKRNKIKKKNAPVQYGSSRVLSESGNQSEEKFLEELIRCLLKKLKSGKYQVKVADAIRAIDLRQKMRSKGQKKSPSGSISDKEKIFWELIDQIRKEELPKE